VPRNLAYGGKLACGGKKMLAQLGELNLLSVSGKLAVAAKNVAFMCFSI